MAYNDLAHFQKVREAQRKDPEYQKMTADLGALTVSNNMRMLEPSEWSPLK
jgi:hypothetical protein